MKTTHFSNGDLLFFLHHHHHHHNHRAYFPYPLHQYVGGEGQIPPPPPPPPPPHFTTSILAAEYTHHHVLHICRSRRWDSNAESYRTSNNKSEVNIDEEEESVDSMQQMDDNLQEFIDSLWILKVFRSYGLVLPFIILSMLITTGLKAFLLALALPLGQSTFSYAIQKMQEEQINTGSKPRQKTKTEKRSRTRSSGSSDEENRIPSQEGNRNVKKKARQSMGPNVNVSADQTGKNAASYGGWDTY